MSFQKRRTRAAKAAGALALATVAAGSVALSASGFVGGAGNGDQLHSSRPDPASATVITPVPAITSSANPKVEACFDSTISSTVASSGWALGDYDSSDFVNAVNSAVDPANQNCAVVNFPPGTDIAKDSLLYYATGAASNVSAQTSTLGTEPLQGSTLSAAAGETQRPDLLTTSVDVANHRITYTFDENLDPTAAGSDATKFGYYTSSAGTPTMGTSVQSIDGPSITINFGAAINDQQIYFDRDGATRDRQTSGGGTTHPSTLGAVGTINLAGPPALVSAAKQSGSTQVVDTHWSQSVVPISPSAAEAYREDGGIVPNGGGSDIYAVGTSGDPKTLPVTLPSSTQRDPNSVVRFGAKQGLAANVALTQLSADGSAFIGTGGQRIGYTDGPDLLRTVIDDANNRASFQFDEQVQDTPAPTANQFTLVNPDGSTQTGTGTVVLSADRLSASVQFSGTVSAAVGTQILYGAVTDISEQNNVTPYGNVSRTLINPTTVTPTPTPTATPSVTPTPTTTPKTHVHTTLKSLKHAKSSKKVTGKVSAASPCSVGRSVSVSRGGKKIASGKSKAGGKFTLSSKKAKGAGKKKLTVKVSARTIGNTICDATSKKV